MNETLSPHDVQAILEARAAKKKRQKQLWAQTHREETKFYGRAFYQRNAEKRKAYSIAYYHTHKEQRNQYSKDYYRRKKADNPNYVKDTRKRASGDGRQHHDCSKDRCRMSSNYSKVKDCQRTLSQYAYKSIEGIKAQFPETVARYLESYPFEQYGKNIIRKALYLRRIHPDREEYDDCYEAELLAYLYSIHRCAAMGSDYTVPYIRKMVRIYISCALVVYHDVQNLCRQNNFRQIRLDADTSGRRN